MAIIKNKKINFNNLVCPLPLRKYPNIVLGHGSGGQMTQELIDNLFIPAFSFTKKTDLTDAAVLENMESRLAFSTDSFVIRPLMFPGGDIGSLSVYGTVNDLAMMGAEPLYLSVGFILEEGLPMETLAIIVRSMSLAARKAGVKIITGDTKVVEKNHGDGVYINTAGVGVIKTKFFPHPNLIKPGDVVIINGTLGDHGMAIMSVRENLSFETKVISDSAPLNYLVSDLLKASLEIHALRDLTRGGLAAALNEFAKSTNLGIIIDENKLPVTPQVKSSCEIMGFDPINIANEGKFITIVPKKETQKILSVLRSHPQGRKASVIGEVVSDHPGTVIGKTEIGGERVIDMPAGELLPRIC